MALDMYMKLEGVEGESVDDAHQGEIDLIAWNWGMAQSGSMHTAGGGGSGKVSVQDLSFVHHIDKASPVLQQKCCLGEHFGEAVLTVRKAGGSQIEYLIITMKNVLVTSISTGGSGGQDLLDETVSLNFEEYNISYTPQNNDGSGGAAVEWAYNMAKNTKA